MVSYTTQDLEVFLYNHKNIDTMSAKELIQELRDYEYDLGTYNYPKNWKR